MDLQRPLPDRQHLSSLTALLLITLSLVRMVTLPELSLSFSTFGLLIQFRLNTRLLFLFLAAALTTSGADWLVRTHPSFTPGMPTFQHWVIPMLTAYAGGAFVTSLPQGTIMWIGLAAIVLLLLSVFLTEFIVVSPKDERFGSASTALFALAYLLLALSFFVIRSSGIRILYSFPVVFIITTAVIWRLLQLRRPSRNLVAYSAGIGLLLAETQAGLHYLPVSPLKEALILFILAYAASDLLHRHLENDLGRRKLLEYGLPALAALILVTVLV